MPENPSSSASVARHAQTKIYEALTDTRVVALVGPRQSGKTTLARKIAGERNLDFVSLDEAYSRQFALEDPDGFVRDLSRVVIDEIQRAPGLILSLKRAVDEDCSPGRFLITGSVDLFKGTISPDSLAGRVATIELLPFSQAEIEGRRPSEFMRRAFDCNFPAIRETGRISNLAGRVIAGGYPEALARKVPSRRRAWLTAYSHALATRDVADIARVTKSIKISRLLDHAALASGQTINLSAFAALLGVDSKTVDRWLTLLEQMFVVRRLPAWHRNELKRLVKAPKMHFLDSGLLSALRHVDEAGVEKDRTKLGALLEGFVYSELSKLAGLESDAILISHFRSHNEWEVDFVLERAGRIVGVEVKAAATAKPGDFRGLKRLRAATGAAFASGILLHDGERIQSIGDRLYAMPVSQLWS